MLSWLKRSSSTPDGINASDNGWGRTSDTNGSSERVPRPRLRSIDWGGSAKSFLNHNNTRKNNIRSIKSERHISNDGRLESDGLSTGFSKQSFGIRQSFYSKFQSINGCQTTGTKLAIPSSESDLMRQFPCPKSTSYLSAPSQLIMRFLDVEDYRKLLQVNRLASSGRLFDFLDQVNPPNESLEGEEFASQCTSWIREIRQMSKSGNTSTTLSAMTLRSQCVAICCHRGELAAAKTMIQLQTPTPVGLRSGQLPDPNLFPALIEAARLYSQPNVAVDAMNAARARGCITNLPFWNAVLSVLCTSVAHFHLLPEILEHMVDAAVCPSIDTCKLILQAITLANMVVTAKRTSNKGAHLVHRVTRQCIAVVQTLWPKALPKNDTSAKPVRRLRGRSRASHYSPLPTVLEAHEQPTMEPSRQSPPSSIMSEDRESSSAGVISNFRNPSSTNHISLGGLELSQAPRGDASLTSAQPHESPLPSQLFSSYLHQDWTSDPYAALTNLVDDAENKNQNSMMHDPAYALSAQNFSLSSTPVADQAYFLLPSGLVDADQESVASKTSSCKESETDQLEFRIDPHASDPEFKHRQTCMKASAPEFQPSFSAQSSSKSLLCNEQETDETMSENFSRVAEIVASAKLSLPADRNQGLLPTPCAVPNVPYRHTPAKEPVKHATLHSNLNDYGAPSVCSRHDENGSVASSARTNPKALWKPLSSVSSEFGSTAGEPNAYDMRNDAVNRSGRQSFASGSSMPDWMSNSVRSVTSYQSSTIFSDCSSNADESFREGRTRSIISRCSDPSSKSSHSSAVLPATLNTDQTGLLPVPAYPPSGRMQTWLSQSDDATFNPFQGTTINTARARRPRRATIQRMP